VSNYFISPKKKKKPINILTFNYKLINHVLFRYSLVKDLGISFNSKLLFTDHIISTKNTGKAFSMLGFIMRNCSNCNDPYTLKILYTSLVRSHLEYASIIWDIQNVCSINQIESVQNKDLRFICLKCNILRPSHSGYENILNLLNLNSLQERRNVSYVKFLIKILNDKIDEPFLLSLINFNINAHNFRN
jgi:hypothetical protein